MEQKVAQCEIIPWYFWHRFAVLPRFFTRKADQYNTWQFHFHWLVFRAWSMDSPDIGAEITLDDRQLEIRLRLPYLITGAFIPLFPESWAHKLWRRP